MFEPKSKVCSKCGETKDKSHFHFDNKSATGLASRCKSCKGVQNLDKRRPMKEVSAHSWLKAFASRWTCLACGRRSNLTLVVDGQKVDDADNVHAAMELARNGQVYCDDCNYEAPLTFKAKLRAKNRALVIEAHIADVDTLAELEEQAQSQPKLVPHLRDSSFELDPYAHTVAWDKFFRRHANLDMLNEFEERIPILSPEKIKTIKNHEGISFDRMQDSMNKQEQY